MLGDTEFRISRLVQAYNNDLANGLGNLVNRTLSLLQRDYGGRLHVDDGPVSGRCWNSGALRTACLALPSKIDTALETADFRAATAHLVATVDTANQLLNAAEPWKALKIANADTQCPHRLLSAVARACRTITTELTPFCPTGASALLGQLGDGDVTNPPVPVFARLDHVTSSRVS